MGRRAVRRVLIPKGDRPRRPAARLAIGATLTLVVLGVLGACREDRSLDIRALEADLRAQLLPQYPGAIDPIDCPDLADPVAGDTFTCIGTLGEQNVDIQVVLGGTPEALDATASIDVRLVAVDEIEALLTATFGDEIGIPTSVDCGRPVMVLGPAESVECAATDPSGMTRWFDVRLDGQGVVTLVLR